MGELRELGEGVSEPRVEVRGVRELALPAEAQLTGLMSPVPAAPVQTTSPVALCEVTSEKPL